MIEVKNLTKYYGKYSAIQDISFDIPKGQVLGLLGLNGAGKSTTMNIMTGCLAASSGTVTIDGIDISEDPMKAKSLVGYLPEIPPLYPDMRVREYLEHVYSLKKVKNNKKEHLSEIYKMVGLENVTQQLILSLSKGYKQRVGFGAALVGNPSFLVLDEPTVGLDPSQMIEIRNLILHLGKTRTVLLSSHILSEIQAVCQRVVVIHGGRIVADDTPTKLASSLLDNAPYNLTIVGDKETAEAVLKSHKSLSYSENENDIANGVISFSLTGVANIPARIELFKSFSKAGIPIVELSGETSTLEDAFLNLVKEDKEKLG